MLGRTQVNVWWWWWWWATGEGRRWNWKLDIACRLRWKSSQVIQKQITLRSSWETWWTDEGVSGDTPLEIDWKHYEKLRSNQRNSWDQGRGLCWGFVFLSIISSCVLWFVVTLSTCTFICLRAFIYLFFGLSSSKVKASLSFSCCYLFLSVCFSPPTRLSLWLMVEDRLPLLRFLIPGTCGHTGAVSRYLPARLTDWLTDCPTNLASPRYCGNIHEEGDRRRKRAVVAYRVDESRLSCSDRHARYHLTPVKRITSVMQYVNTRMLIRWNGKVEIYLDLLLGSFWK